MVGERRRIVDLQRADRYLYQALFMGDCLLRAGRATAPPADFYREAVLNALALAKLQKERDDTELEQLRRSRAQLRRALPVLAARVMVSHWLYAEALAALRPLVPESMRGLRDRTTIRTDSPTRSDAVLYLAGDLEAHDLVTRGMRYGQPGSEVRLPAVEFPSDPGVELTDAYGQRLGAREEVMLQLFPT